MDAKRLVPVLGTLAVLAAGAGGSAALAQTHDGAPAPPRPVAPGTVTADPGHDVSLGLGQEAELSTKDVTVRYTRLIGDSRCKPGRHCFWAGDAVVAVSLTQPGRGEHSDAQLHTGTEPHATTFAAARVELVSVSPRGDRITLRVR
ncbi:hypothetical protein [Amycolatopsis sp. PS_44_ISF1]|uniref:hypothetical protein n=1 Tax=Amycolatopsis sp. PS_44_ISF1 TaxID=2974917 RepID=UPI0028DF2D11|nr:hypothetical protein [Amycolatopsis sp. PS_44_ISF1]MDT8914832.1 hypothetical protein [Amycolatopsis sp. PS_44_ISF1]